MLMFRKGELLPDIFAFSLKHYSLEYLPCWQKIKNIPGRRVGCLPDFFVHGLWETRVLLSAAYVPLPRTGIKEGKCNNNEGGLTTESSGGGTQSSNALSAKFNSSRNRGINSWGANDSDKDEKNPNREGHDLCKTSISRGNSLIGTLLRMLSQTRRNS